MLNSFKKLYVLTAASLLFLGLPLMLRAAPEAPVSEALFNQARIQFMSARRLVVDPGSVTTFQVRLINSGQTTWNDYTWEADVTEAPSTTAWHDSSWLSKTIVQESSVVVLPNERLDLSFRLRSPLGPGNFMARFYLKINGQVVEGSRVQIPVQIKDVGGESLAFSTRVLIEEPVVRVALFKATSTIYFVSPAVYTLESNNSFLAKIVPNQLVELSYDKDGYKAALDNQIFISTTSLRLIPEDATSSFFTLKNYTQTIPGRKKINFNSYRGVLELNYSSKYKSTYAINELSLEKYVAGVAEAGNDVPTEFMKALIVAERSYAYDRINYAKRTKQLFDVLSNTSDQLYLGYNSENTLPEAKAAAGSTMGEMVTYLGNPVSTPYFGRSSGQTKNAKDVWGGADRPWLHSVEAVYDKGKKLWGHGVGMSAQDAMQRAQKDNWIYTQILEYYYTGVEVEKIY